MIQQVTLHGIEDDKFIFNEIVYLFGVPERGDIIEFEGKDYRVTHKRFNAEKGNTNVEPTVQIFAELKA